MDNLRSSRSYLNRGDLHVYCPVCQVELKLTDRQGIEIDYCPKCRGIWLD
jgi:hypothetical protein